MLDATAKYTYYTNDDDERIYQGNYEMKFHGDGSNRKITYWGKTKGQYENDIPVGVWTILYPMHIFKDRRQQYFAHFKCNMVNGEPDGRVELIVNTSLTDATSTSALYTVYAEYKKGILDGPFSLMNKNKEFLVVPIELRGEFRNGNQVGRWDILLSNKDKCVITYDEKGYEEKAYCIDHESGEKYRYDMPIMAYWEEFQGISWEGFINFIKSIKRSSKKVPIIEADDKITQESQADIPSTSTANKKDNSKVYVAVEVPAEFPGGHAALMKWISQNMMYPERAKKNNIQGSVVVKFIVEKDGSISYPSVTKGVDQDLDNEALRLIKSMPNWNPGKNNGEPVRSYYNLPVIFRL